MNEKEMKLARRFKCSEVLVTRMMALEIDATIVKMLRVQGMDHTPQRIAVVAASLGKVVSDYSRINPGFKNAFEAVIKELS